MARNHNAGSILRRMQSRRGRVIQELSQAAKTLGAEISGESKRILQNEIYNVPIPLKKSADRRLGPDAKIRSKTTKGKLGKWQRTGNLKRSESYTTEGATIILRNNARYAAARYVQGLPGRRPVVSEGVQSVQWQEEAIRKLRRRIIEVRRQAVRRGLSGGLL